MLTETDMSCRKIICKEIICKERIIMKKVLTIAGSDCSGGAGIQADLKTMTAHKVYGMSVITALTAQNTTGVYGIADTDSEFVGKQIDCVFEDIRPDAVKIGMVSNKDIIVTIAEKLKEYNASNIVVDPVMISTSGKPLLSSDAMDNLIRLLLPVGTVITPNIPEAESISGLAIHNARDMEKAARLIGEKCKVAVLVKGGHSINDANDLLYEAGELTWFNTKKVDNDNTHGTGCTLSSAIACNLAYGLSLKESVKNAKEYITAAIGAGLNLGKGSGPLNHMCCLTSKFEANLNTISEKDILKKTVAITNRHLCQGDFLSQIELLCKRGVSSVILREKDMTEKEYEALAEKVIAIGRAYNTPIILHTFVNAAERLGNMAIHLSMTDFKKMLENKINSNKSTGTGFKIIGVSTHTLEEAQEAQRLGATYITASHIYETDCKKGLEPKGIQYLKNVSEAVSIPVYALGGINFNNINEPLEAGAERVCMMSEMMKMK